MRKLGISIYPERASLSDNIKYLSLAAKYGFTRVFTCLLSVDSNKRKIEEDFGSLIEHANKLGMEVIADISPSVFKEMNMNYTDLKFFSDIKLSGIRLDLGFSGIEESIMTFNPYNIKIELNMSNGTRYIENILSYKPNMDNLIGCHNFYPHRYTGLSRMHFMKCSSQYKGLGLRTAAFISSNSARFGPWDLNEGLCTLEEHRYLPALVQAKDLFNTGLIDDVIIANAFASENELQTLGELNKELLTFDIRLDESIPEICRRIVLDELHFNRGDASEYMLRSTQGRIKYKDEKIPCFNPAPIRRGDVLIESNLYGRYAGELQIALRDMENSGRTNVVGRIAEEEIYLIDNVEPWQKFIFTEIK